MVNRQLSFLSPVMNCPLDENAEDTMKGGANYLIDNVAPPGNQAVNEKNKYQPVYREKPVYSTQSSPDLFNALKRYTELPKEIL